MAPLRFLLAALLFQSLIVSGTAAEDSPAASNGGPSSRGVDPGSVEGSMADQLRQQQELLSRVQRGEPSEETDLQNLQDRTELAINESANPRVAPQTPVDRPLPLAIFDQERVEIPAGSWGNRRQLRLLKRILDADRDGKPELVRYVDLESEHMVRQEEDRNYDGLIDAWSDYEAGRVVARVLDSNDDGNPDVWERYVAARMSSREIDRDDDGVRDAFYRYEGDSLVEERHDSDNDGRIDLQVTYQERHRLRAEEDRDKDGRMDVWRRYALDGQVEFIARIEIDRRGRGFADTFETFDHRDGQSVLSRREEDLNGDGEIDIVSVYKDGKLIRRDILAPDLVPR